MAVRSGSAEWRGDLASGAGTVEVGEGVFKGNYSFKSRFEEGEGTNPEELIAAAHASCFAMALSNVLSEGGNPPDSVRTSARVHMRNIEGAPTIAKIDLDVEADVPGIDEAGFGEAAEKAKAGCVVTRALAGVEEISLTARLGGS